MENTKTQKVSKVDKIESAKNLNSVALNKVSSNFGWGLDAFEIIEIIEAELHNRLLATNNAAAVKAMTATVTTFAPTESAREEIGYGKPEVKAKKERVKKEKTPKAPKEPKVAKAVEMTTADQQKALVQMGEVRHKLSIAREAHAKAEDKTEIELEIKDLRKQRRKLRKLLKLGADDISADSIEVGTAQTENLETKNA